MKRLQVPLGVLALVAWFLAVGLSTPAAAEGNDLFRLLNERSLSMIDSPAAVEGRRVSVDVALLAGAPATLRFALFDGDSHLARRVAVERRGAADLAWRGELEGGGRVLLTLKNGYALGLIETPGGTYELTTIADGSQVLARLDPDRFGSCGNEFESDPELVLRPSPAADARWLAAREDPADSVAIMVLYTPQALAGAGGQAAIEATAQAAVDVSNDAFVDSDMVVRFSLVHAEQADREDSNNGLADRNWLRNDPIVQALRDIYRADMVGLLVENAGPGLCGIAFLMGNEDPAAFAPNGFQVTRRDCAVGNRTYPHEHGHNMGLQHNLEAGAPPSQAFRPFAYGHYVNGSFRTVMAAASSPCPSGCPRVGHFSNPDIFFQGIATGIANERDNARTSDISAPFVANWRERLPAAGDCAACVSFATTGTVAYDDEDVGPGRVVVLDEGATLALGGNRWRRTVQTYTITPGTVLEVEFLSTSQGEIHGIGLDEDDDPANGLRIFQLFGTELWLGAIQTDARYTTADLGTFRTFRFRVGQFYTGTGFRLVLVNDKDSGAQNNTSFFRNVRLFEADG